MLPSYFRVIEYNNFVINGYMICTSGEMADTLASGASERKLVEVRLLSSAPI